jgi:hypothetical protein
MVEKNNTSSASIDFRPLALAENASIDQGSIHVSALKDYLFSMPKIQIIGFVFVTILVIILPFINYEQGINATITWPFLVGGWLIYKLSKQKEVAWRNFAKANGWNIAQGIVKGVIFDTSFVLPQTLNQKNIQGQISSEVIEADFSQLRASLYVYSYEERGDGAKLSYTYTVFSVSINQDIPRLLIKSRSKPANGLNKSGLDEKLKLEGDFDKYFDTYIPKGSGVSALTILTPDVMQRLSSTAADYSFDISGGKLNILGVGDQRNTKDLPNLFKVSVDIAEQVNQNIH